MQVRLFMGIPKFYMIGGTANSFAYRKYNDSSVERIVLIYNQKCSQ